MKKSFLLILFYLFSKNIEAQAFSVGNTCCNYTVVNYNFVYSSGCVTYSIDVNADAISDVDIYSCQVSGMSASSPSYNGIRAVSSTSVEFVYGPSVLTPCTPSSVIKNVPFGTIFSSSLNWSLTPTSSPGPEPDVNWWYYLPSVISYSCGEQTTSYYIAFRKLLPGDTIYGWILMDSNKPGKIFSYAYMHTNITTDIDPLNTFQKDFAVFPNPSNGELEIKGIRESLIIITNELGEQVKSVELNTGNNFSFKISNLQNGVYFVGNKFSRQKVVVIK